MKAPVQASQRPEDGPLPRDLIHEHEAAELLKIKPQTLRAWRTYRGFPRRYQGIAPFKAYALPAAVYYSRADVERFIRACEVTWKVQRLSTEELQHAAQ